MPFVPSLRRHFVTELWGWQATPEAGGGASALHKGLGEAILGLQALPACTVTPLVSLGLGEGERVCDLGKKQGFF